MFGQYIGQFLLLSGGELTGDLSLGSSALHYDSISSVSGDGSGNLQQNGATIWYDFTLSTANPNINGNNAAIEIDTNWTLSGSSIAYDLYVNRASTSGSSTGKQLLVALASGGLLQAYCSTAGVWTAKGFLPPSFSANTRIFVDGTNGNDSSGNGTVTNPFKTIAHAIITASSGNLIFVMPGSYAETSSTQLVLPSGVHLRGMGIGITIIKPTTSSWGSSQSPFIVFGNNSVVSDLTIDLTSSGTTNRPDCIGCLDAVAHGSAQFGLNPSMYRVKCINTKSGLNYQSQSTGGTSYLYLEDCIFISNGRCAQWYMSGGTGLDTSFTADAVRCQFLFSYSSSVTNSSIGECIFAQANPTRLFNCLLSMTDTVNTLWSSVNYQTIDADNPLEVYGSHILTSFPNLPAIPATTTAGTNPGWWAFSNTALTKLGAGNTLNPQTSDISQSLYQTLPSPAAHSYSLTLGVASSTATPWGESANALFEIAADAGTLTSNTLTLANVAVGNNAGGTSVALVDGQKMRLRIKNTNASSTAMTLAFGTTYNNAAFSISTLAAGKRAYMDYTYDADNSKWDLTGYAAGI